MSGDRRVGARALAALAMAALVGVAGWGSWQHRNERAVGLRHADESPAAEGSAAAGTAPADRTVRAAPAARTPPAAAGIVALPRGCWSRAGVSTDPSDADALGVRVDFSYCLDPLGESTMTLVQGGGVRCRASVLPQPLGARVRIAMARVPDCAFGPSLPLFDALCDAPDGDEMACDIDWGGGLVETFRLLRS